MIPRRQIKADKGENVNEALLATESHMIKFIKYQRVNHLDICIIIGITTGHHPEPKALLLCIFPPNTAFIPPSD